MKDESKTERQLVQELIELRRQVAEMEKIEAERKRVEEVLRRSEEEAKRLAQENAVMAEIGRIISSTLTLDEIYERFLEAVRTLIRGDRITIAIANPDGSTLTLAYAWGLGVEGRKTGGVYPLAGTASGKAMQTRLSILTQGENIEEALKLFPAFSSYYKSGFQSMIVVPLISKNNVIGTLLFLSMKPKAYTQLDVLLAERVGNQIAGAIANAQLFIEQKRAEGALLKSEEQTKRLARENALVAEIGRIINSAPNIDEVFERFSKAVAKLIPFDRVLINLGGHQEDDSFVRYVAGIDVPNRRRGEYVSLTGTATAECMRTRSSLIIQPKDVKEIEEWVARFPMLLPDFEAGIRSAILVPLIAEDKTIGVLSLRSTKVKAYTDQDVKLTESIASQIAGAVANAQLYIERMQAEEAARKSEEEAKRLAQENVVVAEIGKIVSSTLDINEVYERFAAEVQKIVPFDRIAINIINPEDSTVIIAYTAGDDIITRRYGDKYPLANSMAEVVKRTRSSLCIEVVDREAIGKQYPVLLLTIQAGFRSLMATPLLSKDEVIGTLNFRTKKPNVYSEEIKRLAEKVGPQIAGAIANAQLFAERNRVEEEREKLIRDLQKALSEVKKLSGFLPICASCKKIRDDKGYWNQVEVYIRDHSEAEFSHGICPDCMKKLYPDFYKEDK